MKNKNFIRIIAAILISGTISTISLIVYTIHLKNQSSLTAFIANEEPK